MRAMPRRNRFADEAALCSYLGGAPDAARRVFTMAKRKHKDSTAR